MIGLTNELPKTDGNNRNNRPPGWPARTIASSSTRSVPSELGKLTPRERSLLSLPSYVGSGLKLQLLPPPPPLRLQIETGSREAAGTTRPLLLGVAGENSELGGLHFRQVRGAARQRKHSPSTSLQMLVMVMVLVVGSVLLLAVFLFEPHDDSGPFETLLATAVVASENIVRCATTFKIINTVGIRYDSISA